MSEKGPKVTRRLKEYAKFLLIPAAALVALILWIVPICQLAVHEERAWLQCPQCFNRLGK
jgi:hypothetical protein